MPDFDLILSIGGRCSVAHNLRRYFCTGTAYPFDWWKFPHASLLRLLDEDFAALFQAESLSVDPGTGHVCCHHYGIMHPHDFVTGADGRPLPLLPQLPALREKFAALVTRMDRAAARGRVLAVREELPEDMVLTPAAAIARATALQARLQARWPAASVELLTINPTPSAHAGLSGAGRHFDWLAFQPDEDPWQAPAWDALLARQGLAPALGATTIPDLCPFCADTGPACFVANVNNGTGNSALWACTACETRFLTSPAWMRHVQDWRSGSEMQASLELGRAITDAAFLLARLDAPPGSRMLHLGSGLGVAVDMAQRQRGWVAHGIELGRQAEMAQTLFGEERLANGVIEADTLPGGTYELLVASHVLEKATAPGRLLAALCAHVAPGGVLLLETVDGGQLVAALGEAELTIRCSPGLNHALPAAATLEQALAAQGFAVQAAEISGPALRLLAARHPACFTAGDPLALRHEYALCVLEAHPPAAPLWNGAAALALAGLAHAGAGAEALALYARFAAAHGLGIAPPELLCTDFLADPLPTTFGHPLCLAQVLLTRAHLASMMEGVAEALRWYRASYRCAVATARFLAQQPWREPALEEIIRQARRGIAAHMARLAPALETVLAGGLSAPSRTGLDRFIRAPATFPAAEVAQHFVTLVVTQRYTEAAGWEAALPPDLPEALGDDTVLVAAGLFCRGVLALNARRAPAAALAWFEQMHDFCTAHPALTVQEEMARSHIALARAGCGQLG